MKPELETIQGCIKGDNASQHALYKSCFPFLMGMCLRYTNNQDDARALVNESFLKILDGLKSFDTKNSFEGWTRKITIRTIISHYRQNKSYKETVVQHHTDEDTGYLNKHQYDHLNDEMDVSELMNLMERLPFIEKQILNLYAVDGYNHKEIAEMLGIPEGTSRWHLSNARQNLRAMLLLNLEPKKSTLKA
jgi:RNA polymerase sigma-70 factor (ECF subfamily)